MAEKETPASDGKKSALKGRLISALILLGVMGLEGVGIVFVMRAMGSDPQNVAAEDGGAVEADGSAGKGGIGASAEIDVCELDAFNSLSGRLNVYHLKVCALVANDNVDAFAKLVEARDNTIRDRIQTIIRRAEPDQLSEPGLATLKRQIKFELGRILADETLIQEILIPQLLQSRATL